MIPEVFVVKRIEKQISLTKEDIIKAIRMYLEEEMSYSLEGCKIVVPEDTKITVEVDNG